MLARTWAWVMDGMRARILRRVDSVNGETPVELVSKAAQLHKHAKMTRQPPPRPNGQPVTPETASDPISDDIDNFAHKTLPFLDAHHRRADLDRLAVFAWPSMLRMLRLALPAGLKGSLMMDRALNLIALPEGELRDRMRQLIHENDQNRGT